MFEEEYLKSGYSPRKRIAYYVFFLIFVLIVSTLATTININFGNRIEFGQGVYNLKACDSFIQLNLRNGSGDELSKVKYMDLSGFDKSKCKNRFFTLRIQGNSGNLGLFSINNLSTSDCGIASNSNLNVNLYNGKCVLTFVSSDSVTLPSEISVIDYLVVGGGGSGGGNRGGGGGAGAFKKSTNVSLTNRTVSAVVGSGGAAISSSGNSTPAGNNGSASSISFNGGTTVTAIGGGGGGSHNALSGNSPEPGKDGGSGGGGSLSYSTVSPAFGIALDSNYGFNGGKSSVSTESATPKPVRYTGGGGGAGESGKNGGDSQSPNGGIGKVDLLGNYIAAGGGGADGRGVTGTSPFCETSYNSSGAGNGGTGGGGRGEMSCTDQSQAARIATSGQANTGSGGGGAIGNTSGAGGSGVVQISYVPSSSNSIVDKVVLHVDNSSDANVYLVYTYGTNIGTDIDPAGDSYHKLTYSAGVYSIEFIQPLALMSEVTGTTFESSNSYS